jgi:hypothetical protein
VWSEDEVEFDFEAMRGQLADVKELPGLTPEQLMTLKQGLLDTEAHDMERTRSLAYRNVVDYSGRMNAPLPIDAFMFDPPMR